MNCDAKIRPFPNDTEVSCGKEPGHDGPQHRGLLHDYAWPGSRSEVQWLEDDRRNYHGEWPGRCQLLGALILCTLPAGHAGNCTP